MVVQQITFNLLLSADLSLNLVLMGNPRETVSKRSARARAAGSKAAARFCQVLTFFGKLLGQDRDHCTWAIAEGPSIGGEIWHWSTPDTSGVDND